MSDSVQPQRRQPTRLPRPWDSPGKSTGVGCHFLLQCMKVKCENEVTQLCPTLSDPWTAAYQAHPSMGFSRQEYWSGLPLPSSSSSPSEKPTLNLQGNFTRQLQLHPSPLLIPAPQRLTALGSSGNFPMVGGWWPGALLVLPLETLSTSSLDP